MFRLKFVGQGNTWFSKNETIMLDKAEKGWKTLGCILSDIKHNGRHSGHSWGGADKICSRQTF